uniref:Tetratricopeptide repeat protein 4-like n=1 Tax=Hirondellea gigas TaxID=1518452 RepID=A0A2P2I219_9CRUS
MSDTNWKENILKERLGGKTDWTDAERVELSRQLDRDLEERFDQLILGKNKSNGSGDKTAEEKEAWTEDNWKEKMSEHPIFTPFLQESSGEKGAEVVVPDNPLTDGLTQLKFSPEHNTPDEVALNFKDDGVHHFKYRKYRLAVASFSEGLKAKCSDTELLAQLLNNRAAAYFHLGNFRSSIRDCEQAVALKPDYRKAIARAAESADRLGHWDDLSKWADRGLQLDPADPFFVELRTAAEQEKAKTERITRKKLAEENQRLLQLKHLLSEIEKKGVHLKPKSSSTKGSPGEHETSDIDRQLLSLPDVEPCHPSAVGSKVHQNKAGDLVWPVLLVYPEFQQTDFIQHFNEKHTFQDQLEVVFGDGSPPPAWDSQRQYTLSRLSITYEDKAANNLVPVQLGDTLHDTLTDTRCLVQAGTPSFIIMVFGSKFYKNFITKYN